MTVVTPEFTRSMEMESWWVGNEKAPGHHHRAAARGREQDAQGGERALDVPAQHRNHHQGAPLHDAPVVERLRLHQRRHRARVRTWCATIPWPSSARNPSTAPRAGRSSSAEALAPVVWGRILHWVRTEDYLAARSEYFDEAGTIMRTMTYGDIRKFGGRTIPSRWTLVSNQKEGHRTTVSSSSRPRSTSRSARASSRSRSWRKGGSDAASPHAGVADIWRTGADAADRRGGSPSPPSSPC